MDDRYDATDSIARNALEIETAEHADKHGFLVVPDEDQADLYDAVCLMDANECETTIKAARESAGKPIQEITATLNSAGKKFQQAVRKRFGERGEW